MTISENHQGIVDSLASSDLAVPDWHQANQIYLMVALDRVRAALRTHASRHDLAIQEQAELSQKFSVEAAEPSWEGQTIPSALDSLCKIFGLSHFERDVLLLCAGIELDGEFAALCAHVQGDAHISYPTFGLALAALPGAHWSAVSPAGALRHWRLLEISSGESMMTSRLRIDERILHYLVGASHQDEHLAGFVHPPPPVLELAPSQQRIADRIVSTWDQVDPATRSPVIQLNGREPSSKLAIAVSVCGAHGLNLRVMPVHVIPTRPHELDILTRLWEREAALSSSALLIDCDDVGSQDSNRETALLRFVENLSGALFISGRQRRKTLHRPIINYDVAKPTPTEQGDIWAEVLGDFSPMLNGQIVNLISHFDLNVPVIQAASSQALIDLSLGSASEATADALSAALWQACRRQARPQLDDLAQRIKPIATSQDLVLPEQHRLTLDEIAAHVRQRARVYDQWGFGAVSNRGLGVSALFSGPSGTGKTMAGEVLANTLQLDLYRIDLSQVVSKYIGETEKNLAKVFDAAEEGGAILLFDEADALFGKRSEVKDSHDRYANIEVSYLLQRMESYRGLAILTTNMKKALDTAFLRRIRFLIQFPYPDAVARAEIWRRIFPSETPTDGLDIDKLARLNVAGGNIRNIALNAAFLAADLGEPVRMNHILRAARSEYTKLEKALTQHEIRGWVKAGD